MQKHTNSNRMARVDEELKRELSNIINYEVKNSNVTGMISVTKVKTCLLYTSSQEKIEMATRVTSEAVGSSIVFFRKKYITPAFGYTV